MSGALYICYFGLGQPLVQTQVLPYLRELAKGGERMALLTFEPRRWPRDQAAAQRERLRADGISWHALRYHKRPSLPATLYDIVRGALRATAIARSERLDLYHGRSHVGTAIGALARLRTRAKLIFDFRGFLAEESVDAGRWSSGGLLYRLTKAGERALLRAADGVVVLTESAWEALFPRGTAGKPTEVIPCCVDPVRFDERADLGVTGRLVLAYAGSLGGYYLTTEMAAFLEAARDADPRVYALILTQSDAAPLTAELQRRGFTSGDYRVVNAAPEEVGGHLRDADAGLAMIRPASVARRAMSPTKFAEYLAAGLPVVATAGIGDLDAQIAEGRTGVLLRSHDRAAYTEAFQALVKLLEDPTTPDRCRTQARTGYDLAGVGAARYRRLYANVRSGR